MTNDLEELENRVAKLEKSKGGPVRFFAQYLISPLLVVLAGFLFNWQLEESKQELQQIQIAQSMLATLFSEDEFKTLATKRLLDELLEDPALRAELGEIIQNYLESRFDHSLGAGNLESAHQIVEAARTIGGETGENIVQALESNPERREPLERYQQALQLEQAGFEALIQEDLQTASRHFEQAYEIYPRLHNVEEIFRLLEENQENIDSPRVRSQIYERILQDYSWKVPAETIQALEEKHQQLSPQKRRPN